ncbi:MAG: MoaD/ThiS family protein [Pseudomonadota bacterium]|nr:MoaD/ThiS family protein [Pseudomonadota bacterium]
MAHVRFTRHLQRYFPALHDQEVPAATVAELVAELNRRYPGLAGYLVDERGALRKHVNIFVDRDLVHDRAHLADTITAGSVVDVIQALSGG